MSAHGVKDYWRSIAIALRSTRSRQPVCFQNAAPSLFSATTNSVQRVIPSSLSFNRQRSTMLPLLADGVAMVVASPYHPLGKVNHVPPWRLKLSKAASGLYRLVLKQKLHTYTSCFRVYRRSLVANVPLRSTGFVGIAELVCELDRRGLKVVECPATLDIRTTGQSKMRVLRAGWAHLKLIASAGCTRLFGRPQPASARQLQR